MATGQRVSEQPTPPQLALRTLGPLELVMPVAGNEEQLVPAAGKALALLSYLACAPARSAFRERLTELFWSTSSAESGLQSLRQVRLTLRRLVGAEVVTSDGESLTLAPFVRVDRDDFLSHLAAKRLGDAVRLYRGPFCDRFAASGAEDFEHWAGAERTSLQSHAVEALDRLASIALSEARVGDALAFARRLRDADSDDERHWRIRFEALLLKHDQFGAAIAATECRAWLIAERREPSRSLRVLMERAATARPSGELEDEHVGDRPRFQADLAGREPQFAALLLTWRESLAGRGSSVVLSGASGHGKTRLLRDVQERLAATRGRSTALRALPADSRVRFALVSRLAASLAAMRGAAGLSRTSASVLLALNPSLSSAYSSAHAATVGPDPLLAYLEALDELLGVLAEESPLAVFIDDLQWSDPDSARILASLGDRQSERRVMFVIAVRSRVTSGPPLPSSAAQVKVEPLSADETDSLLASIARLPDASTNDWRAGLQRATGGSPLLILETLRLAMDAGSVSIEQGGWVLTDAVGFEIILAQRTMLADRLRRLDPEAFRLATVLSVAGRPLPDDALVNEAAAAGMDAHSALVRLEVRDVAARAPEGWVIAHDALAETIETMVDRDALDAACLRAALVMRRIGDAPNGVRALQLLTGMGRWAECADVVTQLAAAKKTSGQPGYFAARLILAEIEDESSRQHIRRRLAVRLRLPVRAIGLASVVIAAATAGLLIVEANAQSTEQLAESQLVVYSSSTDGSPLAQVVAVSEAGWTTSRPLDARRAPSATPRPPRGQRASLINPLSGASAVERFYQDSGQTDVALSYPDGREERLTSSPGDDVPADWAPDFATLLIESAREGVLGHRALWTIDLSARRARRVSSGGSRNETDGLARWSPDGTRIAFVRRFFDIRPSEFCTVESDGQFEHCRVLSGRSVNELGGWIDRNHVLVVTDSSGVDRTESVDVSTGTVAAIPTAGRNCTISPNGRWLLCADRANGTPSVAPITAPGLARLVQVQNGVGGAEAGWLRSVDTEAVAARVVIQPLADIAPVGVSTLLRASVVNSAGDVINGVRLRWSTADTALATVTPDGLLTPKRVGVVRVHASAGGWTEADMVVHSQSLPAAVLFREQWTGAVESRWAYFGDPRPVTVSTRGRHAFWNRGDGQHFSGAYSRIAFSLEGGFWVESELSTRITATQWQSATIAVRRTGDRMALKRWDHSTGEFPASGTLVCAFIYPSGEGFRAVGTIGGGGAASFAPSSSVSRLGDGTWYRVLMQVFPDGRCGVAVNGVPTSVRSYLSLGADSVVLQLQGSSYETRILVGAMVAGGGVRTDIDWARLDRH